MPAEAALPVAEPPTTAALCRDAAALFDGPALRGAVGPVGRWMMRTRPRICPLGWVIDAVPAGSRVLDIGCGRGLVAGFMATHGKASGGAGVDVSDDALRVAQQALEAKQPNAWTFVKADTPSAWPAGPFDAVTMVDVMHHLPTAMRREAIDAATARLTPGGVLVYKDMARRPRWSAFMNSLHDFAVARQWTRPEPVENVEAWAQAEPNGLRLRTRRAARMAWYSHELRVFEKPADTER